MLTIIWAGLHIPQTTHAEPPFSGTIFIDPDIITENDPSAYLKTEDAGQGIREMFDRRSDWVTRNAFLFEASFRDAPKVEIQVNPEFGSLDAARAEALKFAPVIGRLPPSLREDLETVWIHKGNHPFGGGNNNLLIHTGQAEEYLASGILEETLVHEASHTSLDADHAHDPEWLAAQAADGEFISTYARDNPHREDVSESFLLYYALRHRSDRISESLAKTISETIPNRIAYFDDQVLELVMGEVPGSGETAKAIEENATFEDESEEFDWDEEGETFEDESEEFDWDEEGETFEDESEEFDWGEEGETFEDESEEFDWGEEGETFEDESDEDDWGEDGETFEDEDDWGEDGETFEDESEEFDWDEDGETFEDESEEDDWGEEAFVDQSETMDDAWDLATDHGNGWKEFDWFGYFYESDQGWIYHYELGWIFQFGGFTDSIWFWKQGIGWVWTSADLYPYLYRPNVCCWMFLHGGSENRWNFYDYGGNRWMQLGE